MPPRRLGSLQESPRRPHYVFRCHFGSRAASGSRQPPAASLSEEAGTLGDPRPAAGREMADLQNILEEFKAFDKTGDGLISREEFTSLLHHLDKGAWPVEDVDALLDSSNLARGSQKVPYVELFMWLFNSQSEDTFNNIVILTDSYK
eukprot:495915-Pyramimonas_sp.AAC.1